MLVISLLFRESKGALANHRRYALEHGYRHCVIDASKTYRLDAAQWLFKYETLLRELNRAEPGEIVLFLNENAAIVEPVPLETVLGDRDWLLVRVLSELPQADVQVWRNTPAVRAGLLSVVHKCRFGSAVPAAETALLDAFEASPQIHTVRVQTDDVYVVLGASGPLIPVWPRVRVFALSIAEDHKDLSRSCVHPRLCEALFEHLEAARGDFSHAFADYAPPDSAQAPYVVYNPGHPIAITTLYTPNAAIYGHIAESNMRDYCERHGYTLYVCRDVPEHLAQRLPMRGNWAKPWLLSELLPHHEWVVWLDADMLVNDLERPLEPFLDGRDILLARDIGCWFFNSGVMGFRNTPANAALITLVAEKIETGVEADTLRESGGDQFHFNRVLIDETKLTDADILSLMDINTPWGFRTAESFIVHYHGMAAQMRALLMRHDLRLRDVEVASLCV